MNEQKNISPENAKLTDQAFSRLLITSVVAILFLIACLCSTTYAWFVQDVSSTDNAIKAAQECLLTASLSVAEENSGVSEAIEVTFPVADCQTAQTHTLAAGNYTVVLSLPADSASGYLVLGVGSTVYHTDFIERHTDAEPHTLTFSLVLNEAAEVVFTPRWGIYAGVCDVTDGGTLTVGAALSDPVDGE